MLVGGSLGGHLGGVLVGRLGGHLGEVLGGRLGGPFKILQKILLETIHDRWWPLVKVIDHS